jgi:hypothetical protein
MRTALSHLGHVTVGGERFFLSAVRVDHGKFEVDIDLPPADYELAGHVQLFDRHGSFVAEGKKYTIPPHTERVCFTYGFGITSVDTKDIEVNLGDLPGWR